MLGVLAHPFRQIYFRGGKTKFSGSETYPNQRSQRSTHQFYLTLMRRFASQMERKPQRKRENVDLALG